MPLKWIRLFKMSRCTARRFFFKSYLGYCPCFKAASHLNKTIQLPKTRSKARKNYIFAFKQHPFQKCCYSLTSWAFISLKTCEGAAFCWIPQSCFFVDLIALPCNLKDFLYFNADCLQGKSIFRAQLHSLCHLRERRRGGMLGTVHQCRVICPLLM